MSAPAAVRRPGFLRVVLASALLEARVLRRSTAELFFLFTVPIQAIGFVAIFRAAGRPDLDAYGVIGPGLIAVWSLALLVSGEVIARERDNDSLESLVAAPARLVQVLLGRVGVVTAVSLLGLALSFLTAWLVHGVDPVIRSPGVLAATVAVTAVATTGTALLFSVLFVNSPSPRIFQNASTYPFYVLGGVIVPVTLLPDWLQPLSRVVFLSWSADLLRDAVRSSTVPGWAWRCGVVLGLGLIAYAAAHLLLRITLRHARQEGRLGLGS